MSRFALILALSLLAGLAAPARSLAWTPNQAAPDGAFAEVLPGTAGRSSAVIHAFVDIAAPPDRVWELVADCAWAPKLVRFIRTCAVVDKDPAGAWDVREHGIVYGFPVPRMRTVFRSEYDTGHGIRFHCLPGGELNVCDGQWRLEPSTDGLGVRVIYENSLIVPVSVPAAMMRSRLRRDVLGGLKALRKTAVSPR